MERCDRRGNAWDAPLGRPGAGAVCALLVGACGGSAGDPGLNLEGTARLPGRVGAPSTARSRGMCRQATIGAVVRGGGSGVSRAREVDRSFAGTAGSNGDGAGTGISTALRAGVSGGAVRRSG